MMPVRLGSIGAAIHSRVDAGFDVAQVAVAEVVDVGLRERLAAAVAAARVGQEHEVAAAPAARRSSATATRGEFAADGPP